MSAVSRSGSFPERAVVCSRNTHKIAELAGLLEPAELEALPDSVELPPETGETFADNARLKARAGAAALPGVWVLADDSGLSVDGLDGQPGVHSARYAGDQATDEQNVEKLLAELADHASDSRARRARFTCVLVAIDPEGREHVAQGTVEGTIAAQPSGDGGFGYDPVFVPSGHEQTFATLDPKIKARISHRASACQALRDRLRRQVRLR